MILCACMVALLRSLVATNEVLNSAMHAPFLRLYTPQLIVLQDEFEGKGQGLTPFVRNLASAPLFEPVIVRTVVFVIVRHFI